VTNFEGAIPEAGVVTDGGTLFGTARFGGMKGRGGVFALTLPVAPPLGITATASNTLIIWPNAAVGFDLQSCTDLALANWTTIVGSFATVDTNFVYSAAGEQSGEFFRLRR
jgi:hypothetical protein